MSFYMKNMLKNPCPGLKSVFLSNSYNIQYIEYVIINIRPTMIR